MRLGDTDGLGHLTYCTNIHAGEAWADVEESLRTNLPQIKRQVSAQGPLGVGLRISAAMAHSLSEPTEFEKLQALLGEDYYVFTVNGFPYGAFHGQPVKDGAYRPDWSDPERLRYTNQIADVLKRLTPGGMIGTISTVPCSFKPWFEDGSTAEIERACAHHLATHAAHLWRIEQDDGVHLQLAIEPEPFCLLETIEETVAYFERYLFDGPGREAFAAETGLSTGAVEEALPRYLGVCYDVCHAAVEYEDPKASLDALQAAGIPIGKLQLSSAIKLRKVTDASAGALGQFDEPVYLHQTMERSTGPVVRYPDLSEALANLDNARGKEWRSHFHVPIFLERMEHFDTTQDFLREILHLHRATPVTTQLEVETYTWDVLPEQYRQVSVADAIARELNWVISQLNDGKD